jgi:NADH-quinone oxidoreductase subunit G
MPRITVDDRTLEVAEGLTILQALDAAGLLMNGIDIPHYCWHPKLSIDGSCRLCQVEIEGMPKLQIACNTIVADGMVIRTRNERVESAREGVMELLLVNHPLDCPICDQAGECKLQDYAFEYGVDASRSREPRRALKKNVDLGPTIVFDQERCILCRRCVRFCREVPETGELVVLGRGDHSVIETFPDAPLDNDYSMNVADICPVGALTTKDFRFKIRVWFLDDVPGICTGCSKGCNVHLGVANNRVYRYVPRRNDAVNETWMCDEGRMSYKRIGAADRLERPLVRGELGVPEATSFAVAVAAAAEHITRLRDTKGAGVIAGVASPHATNEDLFVFRRFLDALGVGAAGVAVPKGRSDHLLIQPEKAANIAGARALESADTTVADCSASKGVIPRRTKFSTSTEIRLIESLS